MKRISFLILFYIITMFYNCESVYAQGTTIQSFKSPLAIVYGGTGQTDGSVFIPSVVSLGPAILKMGTLSNPVVLVGYNQNPYYRLSNVSEPGLSWTIEPNYNDGTGHNKMEGYLQYLGTDNDQTTTRRPFFTAIDRVTGLMTTTYVSAGDSIIFALGDGTGNATQKQTGYQVLTLSNRHLALFGYDSINKMAVNIYGTNDAGDVAELNFIDKNSNHYFSISQQATAFAPKLKFSFGGTELASLGTTGNFRIGTGTPNAKLHIGTTPLTADNISTIGIFAGSAVGNLYPLTISNTVGTPALNDTARMSFSFGQWSATAWIGAVYEASGVAYTGIGFGTYNGILSEKMRLSAAGNLGIGTLAPTVPLEVRNATPLYLLGLGYTGDTHTYYLGAAGDAATPDLVFSNAGGTEVMRLTNAGYVGVGISPVYPFQVSTGYAKTDTTWRNVFMFGSNDGATSDGLKMLAKGAATQAARTIAMQTGDVYTNDGIISLQGFGGRVGIGTADPSRVFESSDSGAFPLRITRSANTVGFGVVLEMALLNASSAKVPYADHYAGIITNTAGAEDGFWAIRTVRAGTMVEAFRVIQNGYTGFGNTSPTELVDVSGNVKAIGFLGQHRGVTITASNSVYPPVQDIAHVNANYYNESFYPYFATDPTKSLTGSGDGVAWIEDVDNSVRFHIDVGFAKIINRIYYENYHSSGNVSDAGAKNFVLMGSNSSASFLELTYGTDTGWTTIASGLQFAQHAAANTADPQYIEFTNTTPYRYYALKIADNWGYAGFIGLRRVELQSINDLGVTRVSSLHVGGVSDPGDNNLLVDGKVGIGTADPLYIIHGAGSDPRFGLEDTSGTNQILFNFDSAGVNKWAFGKSAAVNSHSFIIYDYVGSRNVMNIIPNGDMTLMGYGGKVGIGTGTVVPTERLDVKGNIKYSGTTGGLVRGSYEGYCTTTAATTCVIPISIPAGTRLLGVQLRVDTALAAGETWSAAYSGGSTTVIAAAGQAVAKDTKISKLHVDEITSDVTNITITRDAGNFTAGGVIRAIAYVEYTEAMANAP